MRSEPFSIFILGASGFVGKTLFEHFKSKEIPTFGASSKECDLLDLESARAFFKTLPNNTTVVFCSVINRRYCNDISALHKNIEMVANFSELAQEQSFRSVCYLSAVDVYGSSSAVPITEKTLPQPIGYYALSKYSAEYLLRLRLEGICPLTIIRLPGVYGPDDEGFSIVGHFVRRILNSDTIALSGGGHSMRDYLDVRDLCRVIERICHQPFSGLLNVATGRSISIRELVQAIGSISGIKPMMKDVPGDPKAASDLIFDVTALREFFSYSFTPIEEGISHYIKALQKG